jgi:hypothetical protein
MSASPQSEILLPPPVLGFSPTTFLERGVAVPFTTPQLAGARARPGERSALELIVPNPSGGRGVYILPWDGVAALCSPSLHDRRLSAAVSSLRGVTPAAIRQAAREVAAEGFAGREAAAAAGAAREADHQASLLTNFDLLLELVRQVEPIGENTIPPERDQPAHLEQRARRAVARIAPQLGRTPEAIATCLEQLGVLYSGIGVRRLARLPALVGKLIQLRKDMAALVAANPDDNVTDAELVASVADLTIACTRSTLTDAQGLTADIVGLLRRWLADPDGLAALLARPEWLLDGWDHIWALWQTADNRLVPGPTLSEMAEMVPVVPREVGDWVREQTDIDIETMRHRRKVGPLQDWRTGVTALDVIARNETLLAQLV